MCKGEIIKMHNPAHILTPLPYLLDYPCPDPATPLLLQLFLSLTQTLFFSLFLLLCVVLHPY